MADKIIMPLGNLAGKERDLPNVLINLATDMLRLADQPKKVSAADLERYALALFITWWQIEDPVKREMQLSNGLTGWVEIAHRCNLTLPPDMEAQARKDTPKR